LVIALPAASDQSGTESAATADDGTLKSLGAVAGAGMMETDTYETLRELSDDIGARLTGSPEAARAITWGVEKMKSAGLENVHTESWKLSRGWTRVSAHAEMIAPIRRRLMIDSMGWVGSTPADGVCTLRGKDIVRILEREFGVKHTLGSIYGVLARIGYSCLAPRPRHEKADPESVRPFKEQSPLLSRP